MADFENQNPQQNDDPLGDMDPLAWLESLAARQGATEGFTREERYEVPEIDPNSVVIDEPGYTPYEFGSSSPQQAAPAQPAAPPPPPPQPVASDDPLGDMDPMAWLESLAARQGATEGFTSEERYEVPEIDPNSVVIDEPGYTPSEVIRSRHQQPEQPPQQQQTYEQPPQQQVYEQPPQQAAFQQDTEPTSPPPPQAAPDDSFDMGALGDMDPMKWLESLAARQGATEGFTSEDRYDIPEIDPNSVVIDEPGYTPSEVIRSRHQQPEQPPQQQVYEQPPQQQVYEQPPQQDFAFEQPPQQEEYFEEAGDLSPDMDPMAWLESLAARQGATEGFTQEERYDIPEIDPNSVVIDEPGYTPSEVIRSRHQQPEEPPQEQVYEQPPQQDFAFEQPPQQQVYEQPPQQPMPSIFEEADVPDDFLADFALDDDPLAGFDLPTEASGELDDMSWLNDMAEESGELPADFFSLENDEVLPGFDFGSMDEPPQPAEAIEATHTNEQVLASIDGLSDQEIAQRQASGTLTPEQELAWLQRQAMRLAEQRQQEEFISDEDLAPAEASEDLPDWVQNIVVDDSASLSATFADDIATPPQPDDIPDWLLQEEAELNFDGEEIQLPEFTLEETPPQPVDTTKTDTGEFVAYLALDEYDPAGDEWAEALDEEHEREMQGIETSQEDIDWLQAAMQSATDEFDFSAELADVEPELKAPPAPEIQPAEDLPDWLREVEEETGTPSAVAVDDDDLPDWLRPVAAQSEQEPTDDFDIGGWLRQEQSTETLPVVQSSSDTLPPASQERLQPAVNGALPAWAAAPATPQPAPAAPPRVQPAARPAPAPVRKSAPATPPPVQQPAAPIALPPQFAELQARLEQNPDDHTTRLQAARTLAQAGDVANSLPQYETLVSNQAMLDDVSSDLLVVVQNNPAHPVARRLLGDVYMRQGRLQEALDAYRGALDNL